jgi:hypothetical protein
MTPQTVPSSPKKRRATDRDGEEDQSGFQPQGLAATLRSRAPLTNSMASG